MQDSYCVLENICIFAFINQLFGLIILKYGMKRLLSILSIMAVIGFCQAQATYIVEQLGRDEHHIVQSLGAFVGNERAESQSFEITFMPGANGVEGVMIVNTADYRCTFKTDPRRDVCYEILLDVRSGDFLREVNRLFQTYPTENPDGVVKMMTFGNDVVRVDEDASRTSRFRSFKFTFAR